jgi:hypothetical protein
MWWRLKRSEFEKQKGEGNKEALKRIVDSGEAPARASIRLARRRLRPSGPKWSAQRLGETLRSRSYTEDSKNFAK